MSTPPEDITVVYPECRRSFETWHRASMNLMLDDFDDEYIRSATEKTCPSCGQKIVLTSLIVGKDDVWRIE